MPAVQAAMKTRLHIQNLKHDKKRVTMSEMTGIFRGF